MDRETLVSLGTLGISIQPASSKNRERRSTLINKSWIGEKQTQWKRELAGKSMAPVTGDANAAIRRAIQHFNTGWAAGNTDLAGSFSPKGIATQNEKLAPLHTKGLDRKAKIDIEVVACARNGMNGAIAPASALAFDTENALRTCGVSKKTSPRQFDLRFMPANCVAFCGGLHFGWR